MSGGGYGREQHPDLAHPLMAGMEVAFACTQRPLGLFPRLVAAARAVQGDGSGEPVRSGVARKRLG